MPYYPCDDNSEGHYIINSIEEKVVADYTRYTFKEVDDLDVFEFWMLLRDAVIYNCMQSEQGKEYLDNCFRLEQTSPDKDKLSRFKKEGE